MPAADDAVVLRSGLNWLGQRPLGSRRGEMSGGTGASHLRSDVALGGISAHDGERHLHAVAGTLLELEAKTLPWTTGRCDIDREGAVQIVS